MLRAKITKQSQGPKRCLGRGALSSRDGIRLKGVRGKGKEPCLHLHLKAGVNPTFMSKKQRKEREREEERIDSVKD